MFLRELKLFNFKNFKQKSFQFQGKINAFVGKNGIGKTNALDAIHYLSLTKSYLNFKDQENINFDSDFFTIEGAFESNEKEDIVQCQLKRGNKKIIKKNQKAYSKISDHIGQFPAVMISPYDQNLITEGSEKRRKFLDNVVSQSNKSYLDSLIRYNKTLSQRNALLKHFAANRSFNSTSLEVYNASLIQFGEEIFKVRTNFIQEFSPLFQQYYSALSNHSEEVSVKYISQLTDKNFGELLAESLSKDRVIQYTSSGIHKDDLLFLIKDHPVKKFGSQGQQKSFLIALKLAKLEFIKRHLQKTPILLLDDIFDKLDEQRVQQLVNLVNEDHFGQIFISDTHQERTSSIIKNINAESCIFELK